MKTGNIVMTGLLASATLVVGGFLIKELKQEEKNWPLIALEGFGTLALAFGTVSAFRNGKKVAA